MKWQRGDDRYVEDRRGMSLGRGVPLGIGGVLVLVVLSWLTGTDLLSLLGPAAQPDSGQVVERQAAPGEDRLKDMAGAVLSDLNATWGGLLGNRYQPTTVVLFTDQVNAEGCGLAESATGPFYCPGSRKVYIDLGFYRELDERFGAPGDFAQAYVLAHEVGHHVQALLGIEEQVRRAQQSRPEQANALSVRMELQADCLAGVWGHAASQPGRAAEGRVELETGDVEEGLTAASAIGDDRLQRMSSGRVAPERFTHGSSEQRVQWFRRGLESGNPDVCDTFGGGTTY
jgi:predicted metalloprotease